MNIGIIGLGMMGRTHYEAYQKIPGANVMAVSDQDPKRAAGDLAGTGGNVLAGGLKQLPMDRIKGTTKASELIAMKDVQIVDVCVPTTQHVDVVIEALKAGKNVLCEKPLARTMPRTVSGSVKVLRGTLARDVHAGNVHALLAPVGVAEDGRGGEALWEGDGRDIPACRADAAGVVWRWKNLGRGCAGSAYS